jgi:hypothetical protein
MIFVPHRFPEEELTLFSLVGLKSLLSSLPQFCFSLGLFLVSFLRGQPISRYESALHSSCLKVGCSISMGDKKPGRQCIRADSSNIPILHVGPFAGS